MLSDGTIFKKAKFWRTLCKYCYHELPKNVIMNEGEFCDKECREQYQRNHKR